MAKHRNTKRSRRAFAKDKTVRNAQHTQAVLTPHVVADEAILVLSQRAGADLVTKHTQQVIAQQVVDGVTQETLDKFNFSTVVTCTKTGQPIATMDPTTLQHLVVACGFDERAIRTTYAAQRRSQVAVHWLRTSPDELERLSVIDPCGFAIYAASFAFACFDSQRVLHDYTKWASSQPDAEHLLQVIELKAVAYEQARKLPQSQLNQFNSFIRIYLSSVNFTTRALRKAKYTLPQFDNVFASTATLQQAIDELQKVISALLQHLREKDMIQHNIPHERMLQLDIFTQGYSQFRLVQKQKYQREKWIALLLETDMADVDLDAIDFSVVQEEINRSATMNDFSRKFTQSAAGRAKAKKVVKQAKFNVAVGATTNALQLDPETLARAKAEARAIEDATANKRKAQHGFNLNNLLGKPATND